MANAGNMDGFAHLTGLQKSKEKADDTSLISINLKDGTLIRLQGMNNFPIWRHRILEFFRGFTSTVLPMHTLYETLFQEITINDYQRTLQPTEPRVINETTNVATPNNIKDESKAWYEHDQERIYFLIIATTSPEIKQTLNAYMHKKSRDGPGRGKADGQDPVANVSHQMQNHDIRVNLRFGAQVAMTGTLAFLKLIDLYQPPTNIIITKIRQELQEYRIKDQPISGYKLKLDIALENFADVSGQAMSELEIREYILLHLGRRDIASERSERNNAYIQYVNAQATTALHDTILNELIQKDKHECVAAQTPLATDLKTMPQANQAAEEPADERNTLQDSKQFGQQKTRRQKKSFSKRSNRGRNQQRFGRHQGDHRSGNPMYQNTRSYDNSDGSRPRHRQTRFSKPPNKQRSVFTGSIPRHQGDQHRRWGREQAHLAAEQDSQDEMECIDYNLPFFRNCDGDHFVLWNSKMIYDDEVDFAFKEDLESYGYIQGETLNEAMEYLSAQWESDDDEEEEEAFLCDLTIDSTDCNEEEQAYMISDETINQTTLRNEYFRVYPFSPYIFCITLRIAQSCKSGRMKFNTLLWYLVFVRPTNYLDWFMMQALGTLEVNDPRESDKSMSQELQDLETCMRGKVESGLIVQLILALLVALEEDYADDADWRKLLEYYADRVSRTDSALVREATKSGASPGPNCIIELTLREMSAHGGTAKTLLFKWCNFRRLIYQDNELREVKTFLPASSASSTLVHDMEEAADGLLTNAIEAIGVNSEEDEIVTGNRKRRCILIAPASETQEELQEEAYVIHTNMTDLPPVEKTKYLIDSGASSHFAPADQNLGIEEVSAASGQVRIANDQTLEIKFKGTWTIPVQTVDNEETVLKINVIGVQGLTKPLLSLGRFCEAGCNFELSDKINCMVLKMKSRGKPKTVKIPLQKVGSNFYLERAETAFELFQASQMTFTRRELNSLDKYKYPVECFSATTDIAMTLDQLHERLGHMRTKEELLRLWREGAIKNVYLTDTVIRPCQICSIVKATKPSPAPSTTNSMFELRSVEPYAYVCTDIKGPIVIKKRGKSEYSLVPDITHGYVYFVTFTCEKTGMTHIAGLINRSDVLSAFSDLLNELKRAGYSMRRLKSDNAPEYTSKNFENLCSESGIQRIFSTPYISWQNGRAERVNLTIMRSVKALLIQARLPANFWYLAAQHAVYIHQRTPHVNKTSPLQRLTGQPVLGVMSRLRDFGADAVGWNGTGGSLNVSGDLGVWVGLNESSHMVFDPRTLKIRPVVEPRVYPSAPFRNRHSGTSIPGRAQYNSPQIEAGDSIDSFRAPKDVIAPTPVVYPYPFDVDEGTESRKLRMSGGLGHREPRMPSQLLPGQSTTNGLTDGQLRQRQDQFHRQQVTFSSPAPRTEQIPLPVPSETPRSTRSSTQVTTEATLSPEDQRRAQSQRIQNALDRGTLISYDPNPDLKSGASGDRWRAYHQSTTLAEARSRGARRSDITWDLNHGHLRIHDDPPPPTETPPETSPSQDGGANGSSSTESVGSHEQPQQADEQPRAEDTQSDPTHNAEAENANVIFHDELEEQCQFIILLEDDLGLKERMIIIDEYINFSNKHQDYHLFLARADNNVKVPTSLEEADTLPDSHKWREACDEEMKTFKEKDVYILVKRKDVPKNLKIHKGKWVGKLKLTSQGLPDRYRMRWVIKGFTQRFTESFHEVNSATLNMNTVRVFIAFATSTGMILFLDDCKAAYLNATLDSDAIYTEQPEGYVERDPETGEPYVWKLRCSVYGTRQAGRQWMRCLSDALFKLGFKRFANDPCAFYRCSGKRVIIVICYVDDLLSMSTDVEMHQEFLDDIRQHFEVTSGDLTKFLGCTVTQDATTIKLDARLIISKMLSDMGLENIKGTKQIPIPTGYKPDDTLPPATEDQFHFRKFMGYISYLASTVRPDLSSVLTVLGGRAHRFNDKDIAVCKYLARYLKATIDYGLVYHAHEKLLNKLIAFSDASHGPERSYRGDVVMLNGAAVSWSSRKIQHVCTSTGEAEVEALYNVTKQIANLRNLVKEFGFSQDELSTPVFCDSQVAISTCLTDKSSQKSKTYIIKVNYLKEQLKSGIIHLKYCATEHMIADILTKLVLKNASTYNRLRDVMMGRSKESNIEEIDRAPQLEVDGINSNEEAHNEVSLATGGRDDRALN